MAIVSIFSAFVSAVTAHEACLADETDRMFQLDRVLNVEVEIPAASWEKLRFQHPELIAGKDGAPPPRVYTYFPGTITIDGTKVERVGIRKKGFIGSVTSQNPSLKVDFGEYVGDLEFSGMKRLTLNNNLQDPSRMHQFLTYYLFRKAGVPAPRCNFARVTVNGDYKGLYSHVESIKKPFLARHFQDTSGNLYEGRRSDLRSGWLTTFEKKTNRQQADRQDLEAVARALEREDEQLMEAVEQVVDLDAFFRFWAMECLLGHWDGYAENLNNFYLYRDPSSEKFHFIPWGADEALGDKNMFLKYKPPASVRAVGYLCRRLYNHPQGRARYRETLKQLLDEVWVEQDLLDLVDRVDNIVTPHFTGPQLLHDRWVKKIKAFIQTRREVVQAELDEPATAWEFPLETKPGLSIEEPSGSVKATFRAPWRKSAGIFNPFAGSTAEVEVELEGEKREFLVQGAAAHPFPEAMRYGYPHIVIGGVQKTGGRLLAASLVVDPEFFKQGELPIDMFSVMGALIEVNPLAGDVKVLGFLIGELKLDEAGTERGKIVSGTLEAVIHSN